MKDLYLKKINCLLNDLDIDSYSKWVNSRNNIVLSLGQYLLALKESELISLYSKWETEINALFNVEDIDSVRKSFLLLSVSHYYRRSYDVVLNFVSIIEQTLFIDDRDIIDILAWVISDFLHYLPDSISIIQKILEKTSRVQHDSLREYYGLFKILGSVAFYMKSEFCKYVSENQDVVFASAESVDDTALSTVAGSLYGNYLRYSSSFVAESQFHFVLSNCINHFKSHERGSIGILKIFEIMPVAFVDQDKTSLLFNSILNNFKIYASTEEDLYLFVKIMLRIRSRISRETKYHYSSQLLMTFLNYSISEVCFRTIDAMTFLMKSLTVFELPFQSLYQYLKFILVTQKHHSKSSHRFLYNMLRLYPRMTVIEQFFDFCDIDKYQIKSLKYCPNFIPINKETLLSVFGKGITPKAKAEELLISLQIIKVLQNHLFDDLSPIFEVINHVCYSQNEKIRFLMIKALRAINTPDAIESLINIAVYDVSISIRRKAVKELKMVNDFYNFAPLFNLLHDVDDLVRYDSIILISSSAKSHPSFFIPRMYNYINNTLLPNLHLPLNSTSQNSYNLLPLIAGYFIPFIPTMSEKIVYICARILNNGKPFVDVSNKKPSLDLNDVIHWDIIATDYEDIHSLNENDINYNKLYGIEREKILENKNKALLDSLKVLSSTSVIYLPQLIPIFVGILNTYRNENILISVLDTIFYLIVETNLKLGLYSLFSDLLPSFLKLISREKSPKIISNIFKCTGALGISTLPQNSLSENEFFDEPSIDTKSRSYFTSSVLRSLIVYLKEPKEVLYRSILSIFFYETEQALPFLRHFVQGFAFIFSFSSIDVDIYFDMLNQLVSIVGLNILPHISFLRNSFLVHIGLTNCLNVIINLSYVLKSDFTAIASVLYPLCIGKVLDTNSQHFRLMVLFLCLAIIYQHQPIDLFIELCEIYFSSDSDKKDSIKSAYILKILSILVQSLPISVYCSRILRMCFESKEYYTLQMYNQLLLSLVKYSELPMEVVDQFFCDHNISVNGWLLIKEKMNGDDLNDNLKELHKHIDRFGYVSSDFDRYQVKNIFGEIPHPMKHDQIVWLNNICMDAVINSPITSIRVCSNIISNFPKLKREIHNLAFLSCWKDASANEKDVFSSIMVPLFSNGSRPDPEIIDFIEYMDRSGFPINIPDYVIAESSVSQAQKLFLYHRFLQTNRSVSIIKSLLELNLKMGRIDSAKGVLNRYKDAITLFDLGKWHEQLGEWDKALEIYLSQEYNIVDIIRAKAHLEQWNHIREMKEQYNTMNKSMKEESALWFAWAFYRNKELENAQIFIQDFPNILDLDHLMFLGIYYIASKKDFLAIEYIKDAYQRIAMECINSGGTDLSKIEKSLVFSQYIVELDEVRMVKTAAIPSVTQLWQNRLKFLSFKGDDWMQLIEIRGLVLNNKEHLSSFIKMISVLRKERRWKLIDEHCSHFPNQIPVGFLISQLKVSWSRSNKSHAVSCVSLINTLLDASSDEDCLKLFNHYSEATTTFLKIKMGIDDNSLIKSVEKYKIENNIDGIIRAKLFRIEANWQYQLYTSKTCQPDVLSSVCSIFEKSIQLMPDDYRSWSGWAYASSRALSHFPDQRIHFVSSSMRGFLKASRLKPSNSLEYLCQLFSIFFRYCNQVELSDDIILELENMPPSVIIQAVPQIVPHVAHSDPNVRKIVQSIITNFGLVHFQAVVFPLTVLSLIGDNQKDCASIEILLKISKFHTTEYEDATVLIDGMHRSSVSWCEYFMTYLDVASKANTAGDRNLCVVILQKAFDMINDPKCDYDSQFIKQFGSLIQKAKILFERFKNGDVSTNKTMWECLKGIFVDIEEHMKKCEIINLEKVSESLASKKQFHLSIPGTYYIDQTYPMLRQIDPVLTVMKTQQRPRCVNMNDNEGKSWKFLLKGNEDLRLDQRIIQYFVLVNTLLKTNHNTSSLCVSIAEYSIIPLAPNSGLISWVTGADTCHQLITDFRDKRDMKQAIENELSSELSGQVFNSLNSLQRYEVFEHVASGTAANELREILWLKSPTSDQWLQRSRIYTISTALMSMAGYIIGLGDRHPSNIMIQRHTGKVIHIDFGDSFEVAMNRPLFAERVPFRLTRMFVNALDGCSVEGLFQNTCENVLWVLRENQSPVVSQLEVFIHEPIFYGKEHQPNVKAQKGILERVSSKLSGKDNVESEIDVNEQVSWLINTAADPKEYIRHYVGWCPFW